MAQEPSSETELLAQRLNALSQMLSDLQERMKEVEKVNAQLEAAALTTARAMQQIGHHWDAVYEAMRRDELTDVEEDVGELKEKSLLTGTTPSS